MEELLVLNIYNYHPYWAVFKIKGILYPESLGRLYQPSWPRDSEYEIQNHVQKDSLIKKAYKIKHPAQKLF
jgi:hypothetical protein